MGRVCVVGWLVVMTVASSYTGGNGGRQQYTSKACSYKRQDSGLNPGPPKPMHACITGGRVRHIAAVYPLLAVFAI